jgi:cyclopropane-fatty-acyl-phospholipid synthase
LLGLLNKALSLLVRKGRLTVIDAGGESHVYGDGSGDLPPVTVRFADRATERRILLDPRLGAAEAYIDGRLTIEQGDVMQLATLARGGKPFESKASTRPSRLGSVKRGVQQMLRHANHRRASRANVAHHYDLDDRLYDRFLDPWRQYSCAYWTDDTPDLAAAQRAKIAHIAAKLDLAEGQHVLDIGCGWGGLAIALHKLSGARVTGITLSAEQLAYAQAWAAREGVADAVTFRLIDYRDITGPFDRIVSVGMFEHVGVPNYPAFFNQCRSLLAEDGVMLLHSIGRIGGPGSTDAFTRKYIFPGGYIPALSETLPASEASRLILTDCEILRLHYAFTLRAWYDACLAHRDAIESVFDARFFRLWTFYLAGAAAAFEQGGMMNFQLQFTRERRALPLTRDYIAEREKQYRQALDAMAGV